MYFSGASSGSRGLRGAAAAPQSEEHARFRPAHVSVDYRALKIFTAEEQDGRVWIRWFMERYRNHRRRRTVRPWALDIANILRTLYLQPIAL